MLENTAISRIKKLSPLLINQLAAGEVVTRPAAVVKELLENAIDAKATHIEVHITQGGMGMIQVADNGAGIHPDDMVMAITRHATSKVADVANLQGIRTLGFRGEALAATAAVSRLTLISSHDDNGIGRQLQVSGVLAEEPPLTPVVHNRGTTVTIKDLYFNVPARRGNLKSIATEFAHIETIVREVALARADVTLVLFHDNKKRITLSADRDDDTTSSASVANIRQHLPISRLEQALGLALQENAVEVAVDLSGLQQQYADSSNTSPSAMTPAQVSGWLWPAMQPQPNLPKLIYVNGRLVKEAIISNQLRQLAASAEIAALGYALYFELPLSWLNVNVHPSKQRIKISSLNNIMAHLSYAISNKLKSAVIDYPSLASSSPELLEDEINENQPDDSGHNFSAFNPQVQSVKHSYQHSQEPDTVASGANQVNDNAAITTASDKQSSTPSVLPTISGKRSMPLPYCLEVITDLSEYELGASEDLVGAVNDNVPSALSPWLLFYALVHNQGQLMVITEAEWHQRFARLFTANDYRQSHKSASQLAINQEINAQISHYAAQMSTPDLQAFTSDIIEILTTKAIVRTDSKPLIGLLLSSALA
ncbi:DNA mismatch repair endonuclease MutL [Psychrobacter submarinus]|uniref:DNA mismatch repair endonuclease MutL n=1 Tax=Psychrobacter submarinus TaxID=154108 RepID=UPI003F6A1C27